jgi:hypothetical protein
MNEKVEGRRSRREVFGAAARAGLLAALGAVGIKLAVKARFAHTCASNGICNECPVLAKCILPQAQSTRAGAAGEL